MILNLFLNFSKSFFLNKHQELTYNHIPLPSFLPSTEINTIQRPSLLEARLSIPQRLPIRKHNLLSTNHTKQNPSPLLPPILPNMIRPILDKNIPRPESPFLCFPLPDVLWTLSKNAGYLPRNDDAIVGRGSSMERRFSSRSEVGGCKDEACWWTFGEGWGTVREGLRKDWGGNWEGGCGVEGCEGGC